MKFCWCRIAIELQMSAPQIVLVMGINKVKTGTAMVAVEEMDGEK